jgi:hypothetical protein
VIWFIENREPEVAAALPVGCDGKPRRDNSVVSSKTPNASGRFFAWLGDAAKEPAVMLGIERLANFIEVSVWHGAGWSHAPRPLIRIALCSIGLYPEQNSEMPGDELLDAWIAALLSVACDRPHEYGITGGERNSMGYTSSL